MQLLSVEIALDQIGTRIDWTVNESGLPALRAAIARGEFGRARIVNVAPKRMISTSAEILRAA
jgi:hypothetical protein